MRTRLFIDFWNFSIQWNDRASGRQCDWRKIPTILLDAAKSAMQGASLGSPSLEETRVYASYEPGRDEKLRGWLDNFLDRQPGVRVFTAERH